MYDKGRKKRSVSKKEVHIERLLWDCSDCRISYQAIIETLAHDIQRGIEEENISFDYICGIPRGGMIPAVGLSHILGIPIIESIDGDIDVANVLFVDDIVHSGKTVLSLPKNHSVLTYRVVAVVKNEIAPDGFLWKCGMEVGKNVWVKFPWETEITIQQAIKKMKMHNTESDFEDVE